MFWPFPDDHTWGGAAGVPDLGDDDARIATAVARLLATHAATRRQRLTVSAQNRVVILTGAVSDPHARRIAGTLAWQAPGVADVCNALRLPTPRQRA
ncbi:BON domain-containing protein [Micromonospora siamensis]|nr:BON domain-containing protein [Micromonospora siamensis]